MRTALLALSIPVVCVAQPAPSAKPVLNFNKLHHDFGKVPADRKVAYRFKATNDGTTNVQIRQVVPSCGCTSSMVGQWHLKPGESTEVEATFDPKGRQGAQRKSIQIFYDAGGDASPASSIATLTFEADVIQEIMPSKTAVFFDDVNRSAPKKETVRLQSGNGEPVKVLDVKIPGAAYITSSIRTEGKDALVDIVFDGGKVSPGKTNGLDTMSIRTTNERMAVIPIDIQWSLRPVVTTAPSRIAWVDTAGKELKATLVLKHADGKPFKVLSAKGTHSHIRVEGVLKPAAPQQELTVFFSSKAKAGAYVERLHMSLDDPEQRELEVRVSAVLK